MSDIDGLSGRELADAVCEARGLQLLAKMPTYSSYRDPDDAQKEIVVICDEPLDPNYCPTGYRPDRNFGQIAQLCTGFEWMIDQGRDWSQRRSYVRVRLWTRGERYSATEDLDDPDDKLRAIATAMCRAYIKLTRNEHD